MLVSKDNPNVKRVCYKEKPTTTDEAAINENEVVHGWCGTCKIDAKKNCRTQFTLMYFRMQ